MSVRQGEVGLQASVRIASLGAERTAKLSADGDSYVTDVTSIDAEIALLEVTVTLHQDRVDVLRRRQHEQTRRAEQRAAAVTAVSMSVTKCAA
jgi:hypothetical protein